MLNKPRDELKPPLTLGAPKLVLVVRGRVQVSSERVEGPEGSVAYATLIRSTIEGRRESDNEARGGLHREEPAEPRLIVVWQKCLEKSAWR